MYFCLKNNTDLYLFIYLFIYFNYLFYLFIYLLFVPSNSLRSILWKLYLTQFPSCFLCGEFPRLGLPLPAQLTLHSPCAALTAALLRIVKFTLKRMNATVKAVKTCRFVWKILKLSKSQCLVIISAEASSLAANHRTRQVRAAAQDEKHAD